MSVAVMWFRKDLRLADNDALVSALERADTVVCAFAEPDRSARDALGPAPLAWLRRSLEALDASLRERGGCLVVRSAPALETIPALAAECGAHLVCCQRDWSPAGMAEERQMALELECAGRTLLVSEGQLLVIPTRLSTVDGRPYRVFTPFYKAWRSAFGGDMPTAAPVELHCPLVMPPTAGPLSPPPGAPDVTRWWQPGEAGALARLKGFTTSGLERYEDERDFPDRRSVSELSPRLAWGEVSPRQVVSAAVAAVGNTVAEPFVRQLAWREFAHHVLHHFPDSATQPLRAEFAHFPWCEDPSGFEAWRMGRTGYPLVDAGMRQLAATGWIHNRVRLVCGSFLTKHLLVPWQHGARHFRDRLVDYDEASNAFNWQWVAGSGADAAPYFRIFNPSLQGERFDPDGGYTKTWVPELGELDARWLHRPWAAPAGALEAAGVTLGSTYPRPIIDHAEARDRALAAFAALRDAPPPLT